LGDTGIIVIWGGRRCDRAIDGGGGWSSSGDAWVLVAVAVDDSGSGGGGCCWGRWLASAWQGSLSLLGC